MQKGQHETNGVALNGSTGVLWGAVIDSGDSITLLDKRIHTSTKEIMYIHMGVEGQLHKY